jgi:hypothetical protein
MMILGERKDAVHNNQAGEPGIGEETEDEFPF